MEAIVAYCTRRTTLLICGDRSPKNQVYKMPASPVIVKKFFDCSNMSCNNHTEKRSNWKRVTHTDKKYYFCSDDCHNDWLDDPSQIGSWSPSSTESETPPTIPTPLNI